MPPIGEVHVVYAEANNEKNHANLDGHDGRVEPRTLLNADDQDGGDDQSD